MKNKTIIIATDHRGFLLKEFIKETLSSEDLGITFIDVGAYNDDRSDYPIFARAAIQAMKQEKDSYALLLCGSGNGMAIMANRFQKIYAAVAWNEDIARLAKEDDNANVLVLPADFITREQSILIIKSWLAAEFKYGRYQKRIEMIDTV